MLYLGDCLEVMSTIAPGSVDLILCDPPYGAIEGIAETPGVVHGLRGKGDWDAAIDPEAIFLHAERVLRTNGTLILFSQEPYTSRLITKANTVVPFNYRMIWVKDHFANALTAKKAPLSYFEDLVVFRSRRGIDANHDFEGVHPLRPYAESVKRFIGKNKKKVFEEMGGQGVCHFYRTDSTQFQLCTAKTYSALCDLYGIRNMPGFREFSDLKSEDDAFKISKTEERASYLRKVYENFPVVFNLSEGKKYKSNVLTYKKDYNGHHPTQKPVALLEDLIATYSNFGDTVLDFTMGSGSTGVAAKRLGRAFIGIEKESGYFEIASRRISEADVLPIAAE